jgi:hypothetical protein
LSCPPDFPPCWRLAGGRYFQRDLAMIKNHTEDRLCGKYCRFPQTGADLDLLSFMEPPKLEENSLVRGRTGVGESMLASHLPVSPALCRAWLRNARSGRGILNIQSAQKRFVGPDGYCIEASGAELAGSAPAPIDTVFATEPIISASPRSAVSWAHRCFLRKP